MNRYLLTLPVVVLALTGVAGCHQESAMTDSTGATRNAAPGTHYERSAALPTSELSSAKLASGSETDQSPDLGKGPGESGDQFERIVENPFLAVMNHPLSTFSIDVDTASYSKVRQYLMGHNQLPRPDAVRIEELVNYFQYDYSPPSNDDSEPFATHVDIAQAPWNPQHRLARVALKGRVIQNDVRPHSNLVFLIDTSGSMDSANKLPLLKRGLAILLQQLNQHDRVAVVAYAGSAGLVLNSTPASQRAAVLDSFDRLSAGGSTNGGQGLQLAYQIARDNFVESGTNRIILCTDGDFNVGQTSQDQLIGMVETESKSGIDLTVLGFGMGNFNDAMLEKISGKGNGNYAFIDTINEARKVLQNQLAGTLVTIAKDVKIQIEFNPARVAAYRLIGYENRMLESQDFNDDKKDAGEIGAGHSVTALYELIPTGVTIDADIARVDALKYRESPKHTPAALSNELLTLKLRYKHPGETESRLVTSAIIDSGDAFDQTDTEFQFAAAVAGFGMLLRESQHRGDWTYAAISEVAESAIGKDPHGLRSEFVELVARAELISR